MSEDFDEEYFFDLRSRVANLLEKFKSVCEMNGRNFKVEVDEIFSEVDK